MNSREAMSEENFQTLDDNDECKLIFEEIQKQGNKIIENAGFLPYSFLCDRKKINEITENNFIDRIMNQTL